MILLKKEMFLNWKGYLLGTVLVAVATWLTFLAEPNIIPARAPILYIAAIVPTAIFFGLGPALFVCGLSLVAFDYFFIRPSHGLYPAGIEEGLMLGVLLIVGAALSFLSANLRHQSAEAKRQAAALREANSKLVESEAKYRSLVENANEAVVIFQDGKLKFFNQKAEQISGYSRNELAAKSFVELVHPDDREMVVARYLARLKGEEVPSSYEFKVLRHDGSTIWIALNAALTTWEGGPSVLALMTDVTAHKKMEQELRDYSRRVTRAQEEERKRIAYELHDETAQYLSILKLQLDSIVRSAKIDSSEILEKLTYLRRDAERASYEVRRYSHELRPSVLDAMGLQAALEQIAGDVNKLQEISVALNVQGEEPSLTDEVKLAFFRISQEAVNNARKHAKASRAVISLSFLPDRIAMSVTDDGCGFDLGQALVLSNLKGSMGLASMQERARLINAKFNIDSELGAGTTISVELPFCTSRKTE